MKPTVFLLAWAVTAPGATLFFDGTFTNSDWSGATVLDGVGAITQNITGGLVPTYPGRRTVLRVEQGDAPIAGEVNTAQLVTPAGYSDLIFYLDPADTDFYFPEYWGFLIRQQGSYYISAGYPMLFKNTFINGYNVAARTLTPANFTKLGTYGTGGANPNWSLGAPTMEIGYYMTLANTSFTGDPWFFGGTFDNLGVQTVPEPSTLALTGLALLACGRWRRKLMRATRQ